MYPNAPLRSTLPAGSLRRRRWLKTLVAHSAHQKPRNGFRWYWLAWAALSLAAFLVPELIVATNGRIDLTLSDTLRAVLGIDPPAKRRKAGAIGFAVVLATGVTVLITHITASIP